MEVVKMTIVNIIGWILAIISVSIIVGVSVYVTVKKNDGKGISVEEFVTTNYNGIIHALQNSVSILQINIEDFEDKESYEKCIIYTTIDLIKDASEDFNVGRTVVELFDIDVLTDLIYNIFNANLAGVFSILPSEEINKHVDLYREEVVVAIGGAH